MEARRIYLSVARILRAGGPVGETDVFPYTPLTMQLRDNVIECEMLFQAELARMIAFSSMHAHAKADLNKGAQSANIMFMDAIARIPYLTGGKSGVAMMQEDRMQSVEKYRQRKRAMLKRKDGT